MTKKNNPKGVLPMTKQKKLRHSEYYDLQPVFDRLYADSQQGKIFTKLMDIISSEENIRLAYRNIKRNGGSNTAGTDKQTIKDIEKLPVEQYVRIVQRKLMYYKPKPVKRVEIPKPNGKMRPLGIPTIVDRLVQQCILQVMEPICEAKFYERSSGFRPNRSAENAIAQCYKMINLQKLYFVVDIDIKGFFDNVNHTKLIQQIWHMGIRDKKLLCIIREMLKAPIVMPDTPEGRAEIHRNLGINTSIMLALMRIKEPRRSVEYMDNRISLYAAQYGRCAVTGKELWLDEIHCHHKQPLSMGGTDKYMNLVIIHRDIHRLIHATEPSTIAMYMNFFQLDKKALAKLNTLRVLAGQPEI